MKTIFRVGLVAAIAMLPLTACGTEAEPVASGTSASSAGLRWATHEDLVAAATAEGAVKVTSKLAPETMEAIKAGFVKTYPGIEVELAELANDDDQRQLLEMQAGTFESDVTHVALALYTDALQFMESSLDFMALQKAGVLDMPEEWIDPANPYVVAVGSALAAVAYNPNLIAEEDVPKTYEDFLKPEFKGKFIVNIEANNISNLAVAWGDAKVEEFAAGIAKQDPVWSDGDTSGLTRLAAGEHPLFLANNYHSAYRIQKKSPDSIGIKLLEPVPVVLGQQLSVLKGSEHPAAATLFLEYIATPEAQEAMNELEPVRGSLYVAGSDLDALISGRQTSVVSWDDFALIPKRSQKIQEIWGFPTAVIS